LRRPNGRLQRAGDLLGGGRLGRRNEFLAWFFGSLIGIALAAAALLLLWAWLIVAA
jgi:hypothetical protein